VFSMMYGGALKGMRRSGIMMVINFLGICLPRVLWVLFIFPFFNTPNMLYLIYPISFVTSTVPMGFAYRHVLKKVEQQEKTSPAI